MRQRLGAGGNHRMTVDRGDRHRGIIDHPVDDHVGDLGQHFDGIGGHGGNLPGKLVGARQAVGLRVNRNVVQLHAPGLPNIFGGGEVRLTAGCVKSD
jgi:hypothetical protein